MKISAVYEGGIAAEGVRRRRSQHRQGKTSSTMTARTAVSSRVGQMEQAPCDGWHCGLWQAKVVDGCRREERLASVPWSVQRRVCREGRQARLVLCPRAASRASRASPGTLSPSRPLALCSSTRPRLLHASFTFTRHACDIHHPPCRNVITTPAKYIHPAHLLTFFAPIHHLLPTHLYLLRYLPRLSPQ